MTPEKLEGWADYFTDIAEDHPAQGFREGFAELGAFHARLAAKMREPDGWHCDYPTIENRWVTIVRYKPDVHADSCRPVLYLDSLEGP